MRCVNCSLSNWHIPVFKSLWAALHWWDLKGRNRTVYRLSIYIWLLRMPPPSPHKENGTQTSKLLLLWHCLNTEIWLSEPSIIKDKRIKNIWKETLFSSMRRHVLCTRPLSCWRRRFKFIELPLCNNAMYVKDLQIQWGQTTTGQKAGGLQGRLPEGLVRN